MADGAVFWGGEPGRGKESGDGGSEGFPRPSKPWGGNLGPQRHNLEAGASRPEGRAPSRQQQARGLSE